MSQSLARTPALDVVLQTFEVVSPRCFQTFRLRAASPDAALELAEADIAALESLDRLDEVRDQWVECPSVRPRMKRNPWLDLNMYAIELDGGAW